jgi:hypothetical protein
MRKLSIVIAFLFMAAVFMPANAAAPKPGTACKTLKQKITSGGQTYTCIKSGNKRVWSKGVKVAPKPAVTTSPKPNITVSPSPTPSSNNQTIQLNIAEGIICDVNVLASSKDANGNELFCTQGGDGKYSWRPKQKDNPTLTPSPTPSTSSQNSNFRVEAGIICDISISASGKDANGNEVYCIQGGDGKYSWSASKPSSNSAGKENNANPSNNSNSTSSSQQPWPYLLTKLGTKCTIEGEVGWNGYVVAACKSGIVKYAMPKDIPANPNGTYSSRPNWYPTLTQIMMPPLAPEPTCSPSTIKFTSPVIPIDKLAPTIPYGMMVGDHVTPIDHAYLGLKTLAIPMANRTENDYVPVTSPADGTITELGNLGSSGSHRVVINHGCNIFTVYMVLNKGTGVLAEAFSKLGNRGFVSLNIPIKAGEEFGRQRDNPLDFNVFDGSQWLSGFANVYSYLSGDTTKPYTADYLPFFSGEIKTAMEESLQKTTTPRIGKIDQDVVGAAAGNWYLSGTNGYGGNLLSEYENATTQVMGGSITGKNYYAWSHLALARHEVDSEKWIFSIGWYKDPNGDPTQLLMQIGANQITPDKLTASAGVVTYDLVLITYLDPPGTPARIDGSAEPRPVGYKIAAGNVSTKVTMQVNSDNSLSVEFGSAFTSAKRNYIR